MSFDDVVNVCTNSAVRDIAGTAAGANAVANGANHA